jgi:hypothetical protein
MLAEGHKVWSRAKSARERASGTMLESQAGDGSETTEGAGIPVWPSCEELRCSVGTRWTKCGNYVDVAGWPAKGKDLGGQCEMKSWVASDR